MRIFLLGPVHKEKEFLKQEGKYPFLKGQGQQSWVEALQELGHEVTVFRYTDSFIFSNIIRVYVSDILQKIAPSWFARFRRLSDKFYYLIPENLLRNIKLLKLSKKIKPEIFIISGGISSIYPKTLRAIKENCKCKMFLFSGINPLISSTKAERAIINEGIVDVVVENDQGYANLWRKIGAKKVIVLPISSVDPKLHRKVKLTSREKKEYGSDVCFVGTLTNDRQEKLLKLTDFYIKIWGDIPLGVSIRKELKLYYYGTAFGEKMIKIFNAVKIVLNFQPSDMTHGGNMRTFEIPGCGAFQLVDRVDDEWLTDGKQIAIFENMSDLITKIKYYLASEHARRKIAEAGFIKVHTEHTYKNHLKNLFMITL